MWSLCLFVCLFVCAQKAVAGFGWNLQGTFTLGYIRNYSILGSRLLGRDPPKDNFRSTIRSKVTFQQSHQIQHDNTPGPQEVFRGSYLPLPQNGRPPTASVRKISHSRPLRSSCCIIANLSSCENGPPCCQYSHVLSLYHRSRHTWVGIRRLGATEISKNWRCARWWQTTFITHQSIYCIAVHCGNDVYCGIWTYVVQRIWLSTTFRGAWFLLQIMVIFVGERNAATSLPDIVGYF